MLASGQYVYAQAYLVNHAFIVGVWEKMVKTQNLHV